jgi:glycine oxidase
MKHRVARAQAASIDSSTYNAVTMHALSNDSDVIVIGGGIVGLSVAYELAGDSLAVTLLERGEIGREASWAGAGILPPASWYVDHPALDAFALEADAAHAELSQRLLDETGIDDEYTRCGAVYHQTPENAAYLSETFARWRSLGVEVVAQGSTYGVAAEAQVRNPRRLRALAAACAKRGVRLLTDAPVSGFDIAADGSIAAVRTPTETYRCGGVCLCAGAWTPELAELGYSHVPGRPVMGQMLLLRPEKPLDRIVHRYPHYAAPRRDGLVLVGATVEEAGFDKQITESARTELLRAAAQIDPSLANATVMRHWAGLRPASADALPQIGLLPGYSNAWVASGHYRSGLQLAPPTARLVSAMIRGVPCDLPAAPFDPSRFASATVA